MSQVKIAVPDKFEERILRYTIRLLVSQIFAYRTLLQMERDAKEKIVLKHKLTLLEAEYTRRKGTIL